MITDMARYAVIFRSGLVLYTRGRSEDRALEKIRRRYTEAVAQIVKISGKRETA